MIRMRLRFPEMLQVHRQALYRYIDRIFLLQTYNSEFHVAGAPANAENKGQVAAGVLLSLC